ncbi:sulfite exporter TauE/SafE family protein [Rhodophyticola porphyridii]|uniref:Probable membrane transporter protein n=1 Tax=Rhodophyticola porphyridii TaxID=1852017 RepID=A0A3L9YCH0_9RHOB|nr:sulfite exporter TauE/SafE family protein [Rhodophyticola porphyridii]RMA40670.1 sulfite exporter TauE/SafE family protein [Rhodophyticola porphyridii]
MEHLFNVPFSGGELLLVAGAAFLSAFVSGVAGFGGSFVLAIVLTPIIGPRAVVPAIAVYALCANVGRVYIYRREIHWRFAFQFILSSLPGLAIGAAILKTLPEFALLAVFGVALLSAVPLRRFLKRTQFEPGISTIVAIGFVFGAASGTAVGSGMFVIAALNTFGLHGAALLGTDAVIGITNAVTRVVTFWWLDLLDARLAIIGLTMGAVALPATWLASGLVRRMDQTLHSRIIEAIIIFAGLSFLVSAFFGS